MLGTVPSSTVLLFPAPWLCVRVRYYLFCLADKEAKVHRGLVIWSKSKRPCKAELGLNSGLPA